MIRPSPDAGFTLVELLVATTLLALLSVILFGGLRFGARTWEAGTGSIERVGEVEAAQELLRRTLVEAAVPAAIGPAEEPAFAGTDREAHFVAPLPAHAGTGGLGRYVLGSDDRGQLTIGWEPRRPERRLDADLGADPSAILQQVAALKLSYFGAAAPSEKAAWHDSWKGRSLPRLIRVEVSFTEGDRRSWPDLVIAPRLAGSTEQGG
jgi:general secretion pathway protein J